ncbi:MAG: hypothetical protein KAT25_05015 [Sulfuriflexus sp.]|nr:hypothetical protein [Sulfuriflexus sp.]
MMKFLWLVVVVILAGCSTFASYPGYYSVEAYDSNGNRLDRTTLIGDGSRVNSMINANCIAFPGATLVIKNTKTKKELSERSPLLCRGKSKVKESSKFKAPEEKIFLDKTYEEAFRDSNDKESIYEYTTDGEKVENWSTLLTLSHLRIKQAENAEELIEFTKAEFGDSVKSDFIKNNYGYMKIIFSPDAKYPYYETAIKKSFHNSKCRGAVVFTYAKKYSPNTVLKIIQKESDIAMDALQKDNWSPACTI